MHWQWQEHTQSLGGGPGPRRNHWLCFEPTLRAGSRATAWPAGNGLGLLLVEPRRETGSGPARRVGAGGDGLWYARDETFVVRGSAPRPPNTSKPPEPEQGVPAAPAPLCPPGSHPPLFALPRYRPLPVLGVRAPRAPAGLPGISQTFCLHPTPVSAASSQRRLAPYLIFPLPVKAGRTIATSVLQELASERGIPKGRSSGRRSRLPRHHTAQQGSGRATQSRAAHPSPPLTSHVSVPRGYLLN